MLPAHRSSLIWLLLASVAVVIRAVAGSAFLENVYSRGVFIPIRYVYDYLLTWLPFPLLYLFVVWVIYWLVRMIKRVRRLDRGWGYQLASAGLRLLGAVGALVFFFLLLWGYNYGRIDVEESMGFTPRQLSIEELADRLQEEADTLASLRKEIPVPATAPLGDPFADLSVVTYLRMQLDTVLEANGYPTPGSVRVKLIYPPGIFLRFSSAGLYFPYSGEGQVDAGLLPVQRIAVMAHEMAHGYGFGDEGTCSFWAWVACSQADLPAVAYAGRLSYFRTLATTYLRYRPEEYRAFRAQLHPGIQADLDAINENLTRYPDIMPHFRYAAYDAYLKAQGIDEGMLNYSRVVELVEGYLAANRGTAR